MSCTFDWVEIRTPDPPATARFCERVFGWVVTRQETVGGQEVLLFETGGEPRLQNLRRGGICHITPSQVPAIVVYVLVPSIVEITEKAIKAGGKVISPRAPLAGGFAAFIADPTGMTLGLFEEST